MLGDSLGKLYVISHDLPLKHLLNWLEVKLLSSAKVCLV